MNGKPPSPSERRRAMLRLPGAVAILVCITLALPLLPPSAGAHQPTATPELYYSTEVVPAFECDVEPVDPAVVREAAARVYARPIETTPVVPVSEAPPTGVFWTYPSQELGVYVDGQPFIERGHPTGGVPESNDAQTDPSVVQAIEGTLRMAAACFNTGDAARTVALYTVHGVEDLVKTSRERGDPPAVQSDFDDISSYSEPRPVENQQLVPTVADVRFAANGSAVVYGLFTLNSRNVYPEPARSALDIVVLRLVDGTWLIDEELPSLWPVVVASVEYRDAPTPTPVPPTATPDPRVNVVDPSLCVIPPLPVEPTVARIEGIYRAPPSILEDPSVLRVEEDVYGAEITIDGTPWTREGRLVPDAEGRLGVEPAVLAGIEHTLIEDAACENAGDRGRAFSLRTSDGFDRRMAEFDELSMSVNAWRRALSVADDFPDAGDIRVPPVVIAAQGLSDGRVAVFGLLDLTASNVRQLTEYDTVRPEAWIFERVGGRWLIDWELKAFQSIAAPKSVVSTR